MRTPTLLLILALPVIGQPFRGVWRGPWENSLGQRGDGRLTITDESRDVIRGEWDGDRFEGRRRGDEVTFFIRGGRNGCTDYEGRIVFYGGDSARLSYEARNRCAEPHAYNGWQRLNLVNERPPWQFDGSLRGMWRGPWENSLGERGESRLNVTFESGDVVRGYWDDDPFEGRRSGNELDLRIRGGQKGCTDYELHVLIYERGDAGRLIYEAHNNCTGRRYSGTHRIARVN